MESAGPLNNWHYNPKLQTYANKLRKNGTKAEACLWKYALRAGKLSNWPFRRQRPILNYIADFMSKDLMLVIEVDGFSHLLEETIIRDRRKERELEQVGFKVIRLTDDEVLNDMSNVIRTLEYWAEIRQKEFNLTDPEPRKKRKRKNSGVDSGSCSTP